LILNGYGSHLTPKFDEICEKNDIIAICIPPYSSHLLQPLNIGYFTVLKRFYSRFIEAKIRLQINHINKFDFLEAYRSARIKAFKLETIKNSFATAGLLPYNPNRVLTKLDIRLYTPTPPRAGEAISRRKRPRTTYNYKSKLPQLKLC
jgi:hypothetical protein